MRPKLAGPSDGRAVRWEATIQYNQPYGVSDTNAAYINGNPATGTQGSIPPAASIEYPQREIVNLIADAGLLTPSNSDLHQLAKSVQSTLLWSDDDAGTTNQYQITQTPAPSAYFKYMTAVVKIGNTNTGASTLNINAMGPKPIVHVDGTQLTAKELKQGAIVAFVYDGANFQLVWSSSYAGGGPVYLLAATNFYVNYATGDDTNYDGSAAVFTAPNHGPFKTLQRASNEINKFNLNGYGVSVHVADSASYPYWVLPSPGGSGSVSWAGNSASPANVTVTGVDRSACIGSYIAVQFIDGFKLTSNGNPMTNSDNLCGINLGYASRLGIGNMEFGLCSGSHMNVSGGATIVPRANIILSGSAPGNALGTGAHAYCNMTGVCGVNGLDKPTYNITAAISVGYFHISSHAAQGNLFWNSIAGAANVSGTRYLAQMNGVIDSNGGGINYYPGTVAGVTSSGGQYV